MCVRESEREVVEIGIEGSLSTLLYCYSHVLKMTFRKVDMVSFLLSSRVNPLLRFIGLTHSHTNRAGST